jgi:energy-coupling factor transporter ATP-binding protein EcfA2
MSFDLKFPQSTGEQFNLPINMGDKVFIMGANGTGKSSLMQRLYTSYSANTRWISGHRQTWFPSNAMDLSSYQKQEYESGMRAVDTDVSARWKDNYPSQRASILIYDLINTENARNRAIARAVDNHNLESAETISKEEGPIKIINDLLRLSNIPIEIFVGENDQIVAKKCGGKSYGIAELSDGERNALLMAANVLTVKSIANR